jgi:hypothetical protein
MGARQPSGGARGGRVSPGRLQVMIRHGDNGGWAAIDTGGWTASVGGGVRSTGGMRHLGGMRAHTGGW